MGFFSSVAKAFSMSEDDIEDAWRQCNRMNNLEQLQYIYKSQFRSPKGILALLTIFQNSRQDATSTIGTHTPNDENRSPELLVEDVYRRLKSFSKNEAVCMGRGSAFDSIRNLLTELLDKPDLDFRY